jgi:hypothetical protein
MNSLKERLGAGSARGRLAPLALLAVPLLAIISPVANLVIHFHIGEATAATIVSLIVTGSWELAFLFPFIIPVEATVSALIAAFGVGYAISW